MLVRLIVVTLIILECHRLFMFPISLRRVAEVGITDYQRKVWHFHKPRCIKQLHTDDLKVRLFASL